jgi:ABC-2 type transport system ATP-binding protein
MRDQLVIQTQGLGKRYGDTVALRSLDLTVSRGAIFGFLGPNGAGKTTAMKLLLGLSRPTSGRGTIFGLDIGRDSLAIRERVGYLPQQPGFYETMTARETLRFTAGLFYSGPRAAIETKVAEMLALVGLSERADRPVGGFSGGERQRLGIAQAQINDPDLLILDEPAAALDPLGRRDVLAIMERLRERATIFYSTHILNDVQQISDTVAILNRGELVSQGPIEALLIGDGHAVYSVVVSGDMEPARELLAQQPWVAGIVSGERNGRLEWQVSVSDPAAAEDQLLRVVLSHPGVTVNAFNRRRFDLEEIFINLVEGGLS